MGPLPPSLVSRFSSYDLKYQDCAGNESAAQWPRILGGRVLPFTEVPQKQQKRAFKSQQEDFHVKSLQTALERLSRQLGDRAASGGDGLAKLSICRHQAGSFYLDNSSEKAS